MKFKLLRETFDVGYRWEQLKGYSGHYSVYADSDIEFIVSFKEPEDRYDNYYEEASNDYEITFIVKGKNTKNRDFFIDPSMSGHRNDVNMFRFFKSLMEIIKDFVHKKSFTQVIVYSAVTNEQERLYRKLCTRFLPKKWSIRDGLNGYTIIFIE